MFIEITKATTASYIRVNVKTGVDTVVRRLVKRGKQFTVVRKNDDVKNLFLLPDGRYLSLPARTWKRIGLTDVLDRRLARIEQKLAQKVIKETYTVEEVAAKMDREPFTVRQWCNRGQVPGAYKRDERDSAPWLIPHEVLVRLQNEGPVPLKSLIRKRS